MQNLHFMQITVQRLTNSKMINQKAAPVDSTLNVAVVPSCNWSYTKCKPNSCDSKSGFKINRPSFTYMPYGIYR